MLTGRQHGARLTDIYTDYGIEFMAARVIYAAFVGRILSTRLFISHSSRGMPLK